MLLQKRILPYEIDVPLLTLHLFAQLSTTFQPIFKRNNTQKYLIQCQTQLYKIFEMKQILS
jgi:hypothetical protein